MRTVDKFRLDILNQVAGVKSLSDSWGKFGAQIDSAIGLNPNAHQIFSLGENLSSIFTSNSVAGRSQSKLAGGGAAWECLVTWYLNLIFWGTDVVATRQNKKFIPQVFYDAFGVSIANFKTNTESDIVVYSIPDIDNLQKLKLTDINELIASNIKNVDTSIVQCKTNWNDNAQIPMLWDLIYNSNNFRIPNVSVGTNGVSPTSFRHFSYAFFTVPTTKKPITPSKVQVLRVANLTGGNYWGKPTEKGVALSINNFFGRNFANHFIGAVQTHITNQIKIDPDYYKRFRELNFK
jgi:hypothetical protein